MIVKFDTTLMTLEGVPLKDQGKEVTLKSASVEALMLMLDRDRDLSGEAKLKQYELAQKIHAGGEIDITPEEASLIKQRIGYCYGPPVVGPAYKLLNG